MRLLLLFVSFLSSALGNNVLDLLKRLSDYSEFVNLVEGTEGVPKYHFDGHLTLFAPTNAALRDFKGAKNAAFILNHIATAYPHASLRTVNVATSEDDLNLQNRLTTLLQGNPPLWVRRINGKLYVNQAKTSLVLATTTDTGKKQFIYALDSVLEPLIPVEEDNVADYVDIKASDILKNTNKYKLGGFSVSKFAAQIAKLGWDKFPEFSGYGKFTFFIPVDEAFQSMDKALVDEEVVRSHMIPSNVIFTHPIVAKLRGKFDMFRTEQYKQSTQEMKVNISLYEGEDGVPKVKSWTSRGNKRHPRGNVVSSIVKGNIPVQNGVIHLIDIPLVILAKTLWESLTQNKTENLRFSKFAELVLQNPPLLDIIKNIRMDDNDDTANGATIFVPTNSAFESLERAGEGDAFVMNPNLLGYHILPHTLDIPNIKINQPQNPWGMYGSRVGFPEGTDSQVWLWNTTDNVFVDGGGVRAEIVDANIRAKNGIIHQIDQVLGVPLQTIQEKLQSDPMMHSTFMLGEQEHFNSQLGSNTINYTYIVPSDTAWEEIKLQYSTAYKVLFMGQFDYQAHHILEKHLKIGEKLSLEQILVKGSLSPLRGSPLKFYKELVDGETVAYVENENVKARVVRPNLQSSNGYIHVIDKVIMKRRDVTLSGGAVGLSLPSVISTIAVLVLAAVLK